MSPNPWTLIDGASSGRAWAPPLTCGQVRPDSQFYESSSSRCAGAWANSAARLERWQTGFLPVFAARVLFVVLALPPIFGFA